MAPTYESRDQGILSDRPRRGFDLSVVRFAALAALAVAAAGCKKPDPCQKAIDHLAHLSYLEAQKGLADVAPDMRAEVAKVMPSEEMMLPTLREVAVKRFGPRCQDPAFVKCVLAASDPFGVVRCEDPTPAP